MVGQGKQTSAERRRERAAAARAAALAARRKQRLKALGVVLALVLLAGAGTGAWFGAKALFDDDSDVVAETPPEPEATRSPAPAGKANCTYLPDGSTPTKNAGTPADVADATGTYYATMQVNKGTVVMELDAAAAPCTVNSFVHLAKAGFFDGTVCHRELNSEGDEKLGTIKAHVIQCGDPTGTGRGGPGYSFADENLDGATYEKGVVAMANGGANTNGSQFFMMFDDSGFPPSYVPFAKIISGVDVLTGIAKSGTTGASDDEPKTKINISKVTISTTKPVSSSKPKS